MHNRSKKGRVLIVDDIPENIRLLMEILKDDYLIIPARNGKTALNEAISDTPPDLILLDIIMPKMDGHELCKRLKSEEKTRDIPIIFITGMTDELEEAKGLELGAVDYILKPIKPSVLKARVENHFKLRNAMTELKRLYALALDANPLTGLPGNNSIAKAIENALNNKDQLCVIYADLDNFKAFNDKYGFAHGDDVILFTCRILKEAVKAADCSDSFIGHLGGDDFVLMVPSEKYNRVTKEIIDRFDRGIPDFYSKEDALAKRIFSMSRKGEKRIFPIMSISMAGVDISKGGYIQYLEVNDVCAEMKKKAKSLSGSIFCLDRREHQWK